MLDKLKKENLEIANDLEIAERINDLEAMYSLKKQYYNNKLKMLDIINVKNDRLTISARDLKHKVDNMKKQTIYETGVSEIDNEIGGFEVGTLVQLAGQSFAGKTTLFLKILANVSKYSKAFFGSFEMGDRRIVKRLQHLLTDEKQWDNLLINSSTRDVNDLIMEITILANEGIKFFAIDSRMKLSKGGGDSEYQKISQMSSMLSECAVKNDIIILLINQISEEDLKSGRLSLKGSGDQLFDSDIALFIVVKEDKTRELICTKNRTGDERLFRKTLRNENIPIVYEYKNDDTEKFEMSVL